MDRHSLTRRRGAPTWIIGDPTTERVSSADIAELDWETAEAPMNIAAILHLRDQVDPADLRQALAEWTDAVPRLRQLIRRLPRHSRRAEWTADPSFAIEDHVSVVSCPPPGDEDALLSLAAAVTGAPLARTRPLWKAVQVTNLRAGGDALILVLHHAVADGVASLAALDRLADPLTSGPPIELAMRDGRPDQNPAPPRPRSGPAREPGNARARRHGRRAGLPLNRPIGANRRLAVTRTPLAPLLEAAHRNAATVNDVLLVAVGDALATVLAAEGQQPRSLGVSVPVSQRSAPTTGELGNRVGVMPVRVPCDGPFSVRLSAVAKSTRRRRPAAHRANRLSLSRVMTGPVFGLLTKLGLFQWFIAHQRLVDTFATNLHGPAQPLSILGVPIVAITPVSPIAGNVTVAFTALSYAGTLSITVVADADRWPDATPIATALGPAFAELKHLSGHET